MTTNDDPDVIRADIERTRAQLSANVDTLADTANPRHIANRQVDKVKDAARGVRDKIMGSPEDPYDDGQLGEARSQLSGGVDQARAAMSNAPSAAKAKTRGNPLAAGLIAFGAGLLLSSLIPASQREQQAVTDLQENLEPLKQQATDMAKEMADNLRGPAQDAVESVRATATDAAENVKAEGEAAKTELQDQAAESKQKVQAAAQTDDSSDSAAGLSSTERP